MKDNNAIIIFALLLVFLVVMVFINAAYSATLTMHFNDTTINAKGTNIAACRVQGETGAELVIPAPCAEVAAQVRKMACGNKGPDIDDQTCGVTMIDFTINGQRQGVI